MSLKSKYFVLAVFLLKGFVGFSQSVPPGTELQELVKIADVYRHTPSLNFKLKVTYTDSIAPQTILDTLSFSYSISYGRNFISNPEMELLQGGQYSVYVDKQDSVVMVGKQQEEKTVFQLPMMDSTFRKTYVSGMSTQDINDSTRRLNIYFYPGAYFRSYNMLYNPQSGLVKSVTYYVNNEEGIYNLPTGHTLSIAVVFSDYSDTAQDAVLFNENRYFYILNGTMYLQPVWQQFQLQNQ